MPLPESKVEQLGFRPGLKHARQLAFFFLMKSLNEAADRNSKLVAISLVRWGRLMQRKKRKIMDLYRWGTLVWSIFGSTFHNGDVKVMAAGN
ncbi:MAG TPA: hypothetical protein VMH87_11610 [Pseudomonadales bacterium]|nr:hypothetical protein [Pseudomonadales bacterium]